MCDGRVCVCFMVQGCTHEGQGTVCWDSYISIFILYRQDGNKFSYQRYRSRSQECNLQLNRADYCKISLAVRAHYLFIYRAQFFYLECYLCDKMKKLAKNIYIYQVKRIYFVKILFARFNLINLIVISINAILFQFLVQFSR